MIQGTKASSDKNPLIIEEGLMTWSQAKRVKEVMGLLVQAMIDKTSIMVIKGTNFMLGSGEESQWINLIRVMGVEAGHYNYATTKLKKLCDRIEPCRNYGWKL